MKTKHCRKVDLILSKLKDHEAVDLVLYHTQREVTKEDFNSDKELQYSIKKQMELEGVISNCKGMPYLLLRVAELLTKNHELWKIVVEKQGGDRLKGTIAHSKAKKGGLTVYVRKDKDHTSLSAMKRHPGNNSGNQLLESIGEEAASTSD